MEIHRFTRYLIALVLCAGMSRPCHAAIALQGSWIWTPASGGMRNSRVYFRKTISLDTAAESASAKMAADSRYILYVNGQNVGRGSPRSYVRYSNYDTWDIARFLIRGSNTIAVLVHHYGEATGQYELGRPGLLFEAAITTAGTTETITSDASWKCMLDTAWARNQDRMASGLGFPEILDARLLPAGWETSAFDDSSWPSAAVLGPADMLPWAGLTPADIPPQRETIVYPKAVLDVRNVEAPVDLTRIDFGARYADGRLPVVGYASTSLQAEQPMDVTCMVARSEPCKIWVNGDAVLARPTGRVCATGRDEFQFHIEAGWSNLLLKSVKVSQRWNAYISLTTADGKPLMVSADKDLAHTATWQISPQYLIAGAGDAAAGYAAAYAPESDPTTVPWATVTSPAKQIPFIATQMRFEAVYPAADPPVANASSLTGPNAAAVFPASGKVNGSVLLDMGGEVAGYPRIVIKGALGGEVVDMAYAEAMEDPNGGMISPASGKIGIINPERDDVRSADRIICRPGDNVFEVFERHGFRYIQVDARNNRQPLAVSSLSVTQSTYPVREVGAFECSDPLLNRIWEMGRQSVLLNMEDAYTDCPWRERVQWWGDARVETLANFYAFGDDKLMRRGLLQGAQSLTPEGVIQGMFPSGWTNEVTQLPSYGLIWVTTLWDYYLYTGDASVFPIVRPAMDRFFAFLDSHISASLALLENVPHWVFIDWAYGMARQNSGVSASLNLMYCQALWVAAQLASVAGDQSGAAEYTRRAEVLNAAINEHLWNPIWGLYADTLQDGIQSGIASQHANALAVLWDVAPAEERASIAAALIVNHAMIATGTPYFGEFVVEALQAAGRHDLALQYIRDKWGPMVQWGSTTGWEGWNGGASLCHGWAAGPTYALPAWYLGVRVTRPGWGEWEMAPNWTGLAFAKGTVPTPHGDIVAAWSRTSSALHVTLHVPDGTVAHVRLPIAGFEGAAWTVNGQAALPNGVFAEDVSGAWAVRITTPGDYIIDAALPSAVAFAVQPEEGQAARSLAH